MSQPFLPIMLIHGMPNSGDQKKWNLTIQESYSASSFSGQVNNPVPIISSPLF
jgi:hypothetical protein